MKSNSLEEAARSLAQYEGGGRLMAGGTELLPRMKYGLDRPEVLVSLMTVPAGSPRINSDGDLILNPLMTLSAMERSRIVRNNAPMLLEAAGMVGSREIRNMGTLGGNLCQETRCLY
jgi:CO/xanthine dehydrogenase FAD-binding subunit